MAKRKQSAKALTGKSCRQMTDLVLGYLTGKLSPSVKSEFEQHLAVCPDCVNFLKTYKKTVAVTKSVQQSDLPARVRDNILTFLRKRMRRLGAVLLCIVTQLAI
jgi:anti-sigma factor RsiW